MAAFLNAFNSLKGGAPSQQAQPLRLVSAGEGNLFRVDPSALDALNNVKGPIGVVAVCGRARQGKSYILNQLLGRSSGFQVAATHRPCTKGLWIWSAPIKRTLSDGTVYHLVLLDTEGIDAYDQTGTYSTQIFSLAVLLSSMFVYNQMGGIDEAALDRLSLVTEMTKHIRVKASSHESSAAELSQFSPSFIWLLRDFYLDLTEDGRRITPKDYLEAALRPTPGATKAIAAKNEIRDSIRSLFPDRECFTLVRPVNDERSLQKLDTLAVGALRPEFREGLDRLTRLIFDRAKPKQMDGISLTGPMLAGLVTSFVDAINGGAVPTIATSWRGVVQSECRRAEDAALEAYSKAFKGDAIIDEDALLAAHEAAVEAAIGIFNQAAVGAVEVRLPFERRLRAELGKRFQEYKRRVFTEAELVCTKRLEAAEHRLLAAHNEAGVTFDRLLQVLDSEVSDYSRTTSGPSKWQALAVFLQKSLKVGVFHQWVQRSSASTASEKRSLEERIQSLEGRVVSVRQQAEAAAREAKEQQRQREAEVENRRGVEARLEKALDAARQAEAALRSQHMAALEKKDTELSRVRQQLEASSREAHGKSSTLQVRDQELQVRQRDLEAARADLRSVCAELDSLRLKVDSESKSRVEAQADLGRLKAQLEVADLRQSQAQREVESKERMLREVEAQKAEASRRAVEIQENLGTANMIVTTLSDKKAAAEAQASALSLEKEQLEGEVLRLTEQLRVEAVGRQCAEGQVAESDRQLRDARDKIAMVEGQVAESDRQLRDARDMIATVEGQVAVLEGEIAAAEVEKRRLQAECEASVRRAAELEGRVAALEGDLRTIREEARAVDDALQGMQAEANEAARAPLRGGKRTRAGTDGSTVRDVKMEAATLEPTPLQKRARGGPRHGSHPAEEDAGMAPGEQANGIDGGEADDGEGGEETAPRTLETAKGSAKGVARGRSSDEHMSWTVARLKQEITKNGFPEEVLKLGRPSKASLQVLYEQKVLKW